MVICGVSDPNSRDKPVPDPGKKMDPDPGTSSGLKIFHLAYDDFLKKLLPFPFVDVP